MQGLFQVNGPRHARLVPQQILQRIALEEVQGVLLNDVPGLDLMVGIVLAVDLMMA